MKRFFLLMFFLFSILVNAQHPVSGIVRGGNDKPLPFATIHLNNGKTIIVDVDGKFIIENTSDVASFTVSYTGYLSEQIHLKANQKFYAVKLKEKSQQLDELVIGENPALGIIRKTIATKNSNDPEKKLNSFQFKMYNKLIITANPDSIAGKIDSIFIYEKIGARFKKLDSSDFKLKKIIQKQHLYQTEKVSEIQFNKKQGRKETILATRMAGFKQPIYEFIGLQLQSFSVYDEKIVLFETKYANPIADDALDHYNYKILDTVFLGNRKAYMIHFKHKNQKKKSKIEGILYIDKESYAIAKSIYRFKGILDISSTNYFSYHKEEETWFPEKNVFKIVKGSNKDDVKILGETIKFTDEEDEDTPKKQSKSGSDYIYILSESKNFETEFNKPVTIKHPFIAIDINEEAISKNESYWTPFRKDSLDIRSIKTYSTLDSLVSKEGYEQKIKIGRKVINGFIPLGPIDLDLRQLIKYNNYEGFRFGLGGVTNDNFSKIVRLNGYGAYGLKDDKFKFSIGEATRLDNFTSTWLGGSYTDDIQEIGSTIFETDRKKFRLYDPRPFNLTTFYSHKTWKAYIETRFIPKTESIWQFSRTNIDPKFDYAFYANGTTYTDYTISMASVSLQWNPFSSYMHTPSGRIESEKKFPKFTFQISKTLPGVFGNDLDFAKFDFKTEIEKQYLDGQKTTFLVQAGIAVGEIPITHLYSISPNSIDRDAVLQRINFAGKNSFETMRFNEFFSSEYAALHFKHAFRKVKLFKKINPTFVAVTRMAVGSAREQDNHQGFDYKTLEDGYLESGLELNNIFMGLGLSGFYRYGANGFPQVQDNIAIKVSYVLDLGL
ncbi:DUF5686 family protein [Flavobacterium enshiense]|uniref:Membrane protein n=1 Tax=Flavobacterium enshiense DK69 TaxID=1107311 RepID=A0A0A2MNI3_9FLAO|nr:DUF5686 family protein [Flavobacterium enshiense]KGO93889.1 membrane protein [Flavobacterium enshiense DK69]